MSSATLLIAGTLLVAGIRSQASPNTVASTYITPAIDPTEKSPAIVAYEEMNLCEAGLDQHVYEMAVKGFEKLRNEGRKPKNSSITPTCHMVETADWNTPHDSQTYHPRT
jgi:hypothetical protein